MIRGPEHMLNSSFPRVSPYPMVLQTYYAEPSSLNMAHGIVFLMVFCLFNFSNKITINLYDYAKSPSFASFLRPFVSFLVLWSNLLIFLTKSNITIIVNTSRI